MLLSLPFMNIFECPFANSGQLQALGLKADRFQRFAVSERILPDLLHIFTDCDLFQLDAAGKGIVQDTLHIAAYYCTL